MSVRFFLTNKIQTMAKNIFNSIKLNRPNRNTFDLSHDVKMSANMGDLIPVMCTECVPGDKFNIGAEAMVRFAPLVSPVMHRFNVTIHYFFVPNRLLWANWTKFITQTKISGVVPPFPTLTYNGVDYTPLCDYLGLPPLTDGSVERKVSALPFAAYQMIFRDYYRDQNLINDPFSNSLTPSDVPPLTDGSNDGFYSRYTTLRKRAWEHDYFTSALPFAQKGDAVNLPIGEFNDVDVKIKSDNGRVLTASPSNVTLEDGAPNNPNIGAERMYAETSELEASSTTVNDLRRAFRLQEWLERNARAGTRYIENILAHFGVRSSDARLNRPEYITGIKTPIMVSEVLNTTGTEDLPQANMAGHGIAVVNGGTKSYFCEEHGYILGIMSVMPKTAYQQGIPKHFLKHTDPFQYFWPSFANIGEQEILQQELYANSANPNNVFGYTPRYAEYKYEINRVAGEFRTSLAHWHAGRIFASDPALNGTFVTSNPTDRIFAVTDEGTQKLYCHVFNKVWASRLMPKYGTPIGV